MSKVQRKMQVRFPSDIWLKRNAADQIRSRQKQPSQADGLIPYFISASIFLLNAIAKGTSMVMKSPTEARHKASFRETGMNRDPLTGYCFTFGEVIL